MKLESLHTLGGSDTGSSATQPTLSVAGRVDGEAYTVTAGARSLSISAQSGATLLTTVEQASTGASVTVTGAATTTPSWNAPPGTTVGEACNVLTVATLGGLTSHVGFTEYTAGSGGGGGSPTSEEILRWTFAGADIASLTGSGNVTDDAGATIVVGYNKFNQSGTLATDTADIVAGGLELVRADGNAIGGIALDLTDVLAACEPERDTLLCFIHFDSISGTEIAGQFIIVGAADVQNSISNNPNRGLFIDVVTAGADVDIKNRQYTSGATNVKLSDYGTAMPSSGTMLLEISASRVFAGWSDLASPDRQDYVTGTSLGSSGQASGGVGPTLPANPYTWLTITANPQAGGAKTLLISEIVWYRLAQGATA